LDAGGQALKFQTLVALSEKVRATTKKKEKSASEADTIQTVWSIFEESRA
jgi:hypothetical protein